MDGTTFVSPRHDSHAGGLGGSACAPLTTWGNMHAGSNCLLDLSYKGCNAPAMACPSRCAHLHQTSSLWPVCLPWLCTTAPEHLCTNTHILLRVPGNEHVQLLVLPIVVLPIFVDAFLHRPAAPNGNLGVCFCLCNSSMHKGLMQQCGRLPARSRNQVGHPTSKDILSSTLPGYITTWLEEKKTEGC